MAIILPKQKIELPKNLDKLTEVNFISYLNWGNESSIIKKIILNPFTDSLKGESKYSKDKRPKNEKTEEIEISENYSFQITTKPTTLRPAYSDVLDEFSNYIDFLLEQYDNNIQRKDIRTINNEVYVCLDDVKSKLEEIKNTTKGKAGVSQSIDLVTPEEYDKEVEETLIVDFKRPYSKLTESNAIFYLDSDRFLKEGNERTKQFKQILDEDVAKTVGDIIDETIPLSYSFSKTTFIYQLEPRTSTKYKTVLDAFIKEKKIPKTISSRTTFADFQKIELYFSELKGKLEEKEIIDEDFKATYAPARREDKIFVRLNGLKDSLEKYKKMNESKNVEKNLMAYINK